MITWFNYSLDNKLLCEHLFKEPKLVPAMEFAVELELFSAFGNFKKTNGNGFKNLYKSATCQKK